MIGHTIQKTQACPGKQLFACIVFFVGSTSMLHLKTDLNINKATQTVYFTFERLIYLMIGDLNSD